jgi:tetratricopeptide (TPR) repeat protein
MALIQTPNYSQHREAFDRGSLASRTSVACEVTPLLYDTAFKYRNNAWHALYPRTRNIRPSAVDLLCLISFFEANKIPTFVLRRYYSKSAAGKFWCTMLIHRELGKDIATLKNKRLVEEGSDSYTLKVDNAVQFHTQRWLESNMCLEKWQRTYLGLIADVFPTGEYENWRRCEQLLPHIIPFYGAEVTDARSRESWAQIITHVAWYFWEKGEFSKAKENIDRAINLRSQLFGTGHERTLCSMEILAGVLASQGEHEKAESLHRHILRELRQNLDSHHPRVLTSMGNLALVLLQRRLYPESEKLTRQALEHSRRAPVVQHIEFLTTLNNLALLLHAQGQNKEAEACSRQALKGFQTRCGKRHPNTLTTMTNLGTICADQKEAEVLLRRSFRWKQEQLGTSHPSTLMSESNLSSFLQQKERDKEARALDQTKSKCWSIGSRRPYPCITFLQCRGLMQELKKLFAMSSDRSDAVSGGVPYKEMM